MIPIVGELFHSHITEMCGQWCAGGCSANHGKQRRVRIAAQEFLRWNWVFVTHSHLPLKQHEEPIPVFPKKHLHAAFFIWDQQPWHHEAHHPGIMENFFKVYFLYKVWNYIHRKCANTMNEYCLISTLKLLVFKLLHIKNSALGDPE